MVCYVFFFIIAFNFLLEAAVAVQKSRKTRSRRGMRRSHDQIKPVQLIKDSVSGVARLMHNIGEDGYYKGNQVINFESTE